MGQGQSYCGENVNDKRRENVAILSLEAICNWTGSCRCNFVVGNTRLVKCAAYGNKSLKCGKQNHFADMYKPGSISSRKDQGGRENEVIPRNVVTLRNTIVHQDINPQVMVMPQITMTFQLRKHIFEQSDHTMIRLKFIMMLIWKVLLS